jgi:hypothetical protein
VTLPSPASKPLALKNTTLAHGRNAAPMATTLAVNATHDHFSWRPMGGEGTASVQGLLKEP